MNRRIATGLLLLALPLCAMPQLAPVADAVTWSAEAVAVAGAAGERLYRLQLTGRITPGYIVYGSDFNAEMGPRPTRLRFDAASSATTREPLRSLGTHKGRDKAFKTDYTYFEGQASLSQMIAVGTGITKITGKVVGQTCHEADGTCVLFNAPFEVTLP